MTVVAVSPSLSDAPNPRQIHTSDSDEVSHNGSDRVRNHQDESQIRILPKSADSRDTSDFNAVIEIVVGDQGHSLYAHAAILRRCSPGLYRLTKKTENGIIRLPDDKLIVVDNFLTWAYYDRVTPAMHASADSLDALIDLCIFAEKVSADDLRDSIMEVLSQIQGSITMIPVETCTYVWARTLYTSPLRRFLKDWWKKYGRMDQVTQELLERIPDLAAWLLRSFMKDRHPQAQIDTSEIGPSQIAGVKKSKDKWSRRISGTPHST